MNGGVGIKVQFMIDEANLALLERMGLISSEEHLKLRQETAPEHVSDEKGLGKEHGTDTWEDPKKEEALNPLASFVLMAFGALIIQNELRKPKLEKEESMPELWLSEVDVRRLDSLNDNIERLVESMERLTKSLEASTKEPEHGGPR